MVDDLVGAPDPQVGVLLTGETSVGLVLGRCARPHRDREIGRLPLCLHNSA